jgi:hypothetical protein
VETGGMLYADEYEERVVDGDEYFEVSWVCTSVSFERVTNTYLEQFRKDMLFLALYLVCFLIYPPQD